MPTKIGRTVPRRRARRGEGDRLREEIIDAAEVLLLKTKDADAVSVRAVADAVGVTPPSIYMHFANKDDLIIEVCERNYRALDAVMRRAAAGIDDPVDAVKAMGRAYVRFGLERPEQYRLLFMTPRPAIPTDEMRKRIESLSGFGLVVGAVQRCIDDGRFLPADAFTVACGLWMGVHGMVSLLISSPSFPWPKRKILVEEGIDTMCRGLSRAKGPQG